MARITRGAIPCPLRVIREIRRLVIMFKNFETESLPKCYDK
jgi:hypothetical protein